MKLNLPGLLKEKLPSGNSRYRVRVEGRPNKRIRLHIEPDHKDFLEHYHAARAGIEITPETRLEDTVPRHSVAWLTYKYMADFEEKVEAGLFSPLTLKKKKHFMTLLRKDCGEYAMQIPQAHIVSIRDSLSATPAAADSMVGAIRAMFRWACERGYCDFNPAIGIAGIDRGRGGAEPWTVGDLKKYRDHHPPGTTAHLALTLFMFTACRISDAVHLGRSNEFERDGIRGIHWQPRKKGSAFVEIPMLPPLLNATRAAKVQGATYLLTTKGKPFSTPDALGQRFRKWCDTAGLPDRSSHGIRKAAGHLLAKEGCSQYQIMTIHGHTQARTSEVYTKGVERWKMAAEAMRKLQSMDW